MSVFNVERTFSVIPWSEVLVLLCVEAEDWSGLVLVELVLGCVLDSVLLLG